MFRYYWRQTRCLLSRGLLRAAVAKRLATAPWAGRLMRSEAFRSLYLQRIRRLAAVVRPAHFTLETQNLCNASCSMCPSPRLKRPRSRLDFALFRKGVEEAVRHFHPTAFYLSGLGEPLLAGDIGERIAYIKGRCDARVRLFTNGSFLGPQNRARLIESGLDELIVSLNAASEGSRRRIMGLDLRGAEEDVESLLAEKRSRGSAAPFVTVSFVVLPENRAEIRSFARRWTRKADLVVFTGKENWAGLEGVRPDPSRRRPYPCFYPFAAMEVQADGLAVPCCRDAEGRLVLGDLRSQTLAEIWNGERARELRRLHLEGRSDELELCRDCDTPDTVAFNWLASGLAP